MGLPPAALQEPPASTAALPELLLWVGILIVAAVVGWLAVRAVRRRIDDPDEGSAAGFTVADLRALRDGGELTEEQFRRAVDAMAKDPQPAAGASRRGAGDAKGSLD